jgi:regulator of replication initiation timing
MKTLLEQMEELKARMARLESYVGIVPEEMVAEKVERRLSKNQLRQRLNAKETARVKADITAFLSERGRPQHLTTIGRKVGVKSKGALHSYLAQLKKSGDVKSSGRGYYEASKKGGQMTLALPGQG